MYLRSTLLAAALFVASCAGLKANEQSPSDASVDVANETSPPDASPEADGAPDVAMEACASSCAAEATFSCSPTGVVRACVSSEGCLVWHDVGPCPEEHLCCNGVCVIDDGLVDPACVEPLPDGYDYYVDANEVLDGAGDGTHAAPFRTVTRAFEAAVGDSHLATTGVRIYVARGRYDEPHGETFPLVVPGGVSLVGAGANRTTIAGFHDFMSTSRGATRVDEYFLAMVIGDADLPTSISGFTLLPGDVIRGRLQTGIFCDRGTPPSDAGTNAPNTIVSDVHIGPGFETGIVVTSSAAGKPGCTLRLKGSTIEGGRSGLSAGCGEDFRILQALELGDGTPEGGNTFTLQSSDDGFGVAANVGCLTSLSVSYNKFVRVNEGLIIGAQLGTPPVFMTANLDHNVFDQLDYVGMSVFGGGVVFNTFNDNRFTNITVNHGYLGKGYAKGLHVSGTIEAAYPKFTQARNNYFYRNDTAIQFDSSGVLTQSLVGIDFGNADDPGKNIFHCNGKILGNEGLGSLVFDFDQVPAPVTFPSFQGNVWDVSFGLLMMPGTFNNGYPDAQILRRSSLITVTVDGATLPPTGTLPDCQ